MATNQEVIDAKKQVDDVGELGIDLNILAAIFGGTEPIQVLIKRGDDVFDMTKLKTRLESGNANEVTMISDVEDSILASVGATVATAGSIRKALTDLVVLHNADIAAT